MEYDMTVSPSRRTPFTAAELWRGFVLSVKLDAQLQHSREMIVVAVRRTPTIRRRCKSLKGVKLECTCIPFPQVPHRRPLQSPRFYCQHRYLQQ